LEAVQIASSRPYNIILMDCNMPIMDGWEVRISERNRNSERQLWMYILWYKCFMPTSKMV